MNLEMNLLPYEFFEVLQNNSIGVKHPDAEENIPNYEIILGVLLLLVANKKYKTEKRKFPSIKPTLNLLRKLTSALFYIATLFFIYPLLFVVLFTFSIFRQLVALVLRAKHGQNFAGLLEGGDAIWAVEDVSKCVINVLLIVNFDDSKDQIFFTSFYKHIYETFVANRLQFWKLFSLREKMLGYSYLKKDKVHLLNCIKVMPGIEDQKELQEYVTRNNNACLPMEHKSLWEVHIGTKALHWTKNNENFCSQYPVYFRFHHCLGDGLALLKLLMATLGDKKDNVYFKEKYFTSPQTIKNFPDHLKTFFIKIAFFLYSPIVLFKLLRRQEDFNTLHGSNLCGEKILVWLTERNEKFVNVVKRIKKKYTSVSFSNVILAAISHSVCVHLENENVEIPAHVHTVIPTITNSSLKLLEINNRDLPLYNTFTVGEVLLPIKKHPKENSPKTRILEVRNNLQTLFESGEFQMNSWLISTFAKYIPAQILKKLLKVNSTLIVSNVPGTEKVHFLDKPVQDVIFWIPHRFLAGVAFSVLTYDCRFQLGLSVDKSLISSVEKVQQLLENTLDFLEQA